MQYHLVDVDNSWGSIYLKIEMKSPDEKNYHFINHEDAGLLDKFAIILRKQSRYASISSDASWNTEPNPRGAEIALISEQPLHEILDHLSRESGEELTFSRYAEYIRSNSIAFGLYKGSYIEHAKLSPSGNLRIRMDIFENSEESIEDILAYLKAHEIKAELINARKSELLEGPEPKFEAQELKAAQSQSKWISYKEHTISILAEDVDKFAALMCREKLDVQPNKSSNLEKMHHRFDISSMLDLYITWASTKLKNKVYLLNNGNFLLVSRNDNGRVDTNEVSIAELAPMLSSKKEKAARVVKGLMYKLHTSRHFLGVEPEKGCIALQALSQRFLAQRAAACSSPEVAAESPVPAAPPACSSSSASSSLMKRYAL